MGTNLISFGSSFKSPSTKVSRDIYIKPLYKQLIIIRTSRLKNWKCVLKILYATYTRTNINPSCHTTIVGRVKLLSTRVRGPNPGRERTNRSLTGKIRTYQVTNVLNNLLGIKLDSIERFLPVFKGTFTHSVIVLTIFGVDTTMLDFL